MYRRHRRQRMKIAVLALGTVLGFASGFHSLRCAEGRKAARNVDLFLMGRSELP